MEMLEVLHVVRQTLLVRLVCGRGFITVAYTGKGFVCTDLSVPSNALESGANVVPTAFHLTKQSQELAELA